MGKSRPRKEMRFFTGDNLKHEYSVLANKRLNMSIDFFNVQRFSVQQRPFTAKSRQTLVNRIHIKNPLIND